jgi:Fe-Mn family superoxide dismutase
VTNLNNLVKDTEYADMSLDDIITKADGGIFNNAAQHWNHSFYWECLSPNGGGEPTNELLDQINNAFGSFAEFKDEFTQTAIKTFGSGWAWLVKNRDGSITITSTSNAGNPLTEGQTPLLTCDVWEHAYYIDYRNARPKYMEAFWNLVNWEHVTKQIAL